MAIFINFSYIADGFFQVFVIGAKKVEWSLTYQVLNAV